MGPHGWHWWLRTDAGLMARLAIGVAIFVGLALRDLALNGRRATRWREYLFLLACTGAGIGYGALNDAATSRISWEYFYFGKGLSEVLGPRTPPEESALRRESVKIGMKAAGSAALLGGALLLLCNNPTPSFPSYSYRRLVGLLPLIIVLTAGLAIAMGVAGYAGGLTWMSVDFRLMMQEGLWRPPRFQCAFGVHLGGYVGGVLGFALVAWKLYHGRRAGLPGAARLALVG